MTLTTYAVPMHGRSLNHTLVLARVLADGDDQSHATKTRLHAGARQPEPEESSGFWGATAQVQPDKAPCAHGRYRRVGFAGGGCMCHR